MCTVCGRCALVCACSLNWAITLQMMWEYVYTSHTTQHRKGQAIALNVLWTRSRSHTHTYTSTQPVDRCGYGCLASFIINAIYYENDSVRLVISLPFQWQQVVTFHCGEHERTKKKYSKFSLHRRDRDSERGREKLKEINFKFFQMGFRFSFAVRIRMNGKWESIKSAKLADFFYFNFSKLKNKCFAYHERKSWILRCKFFQL